MMSRKFSQLTTYLEISEEKTSTNKKTEKKLQWGEVQVSNETNLGEFSECCWMTRMKRVAKILDWKATNSFEWTVDTRKPSTYNHEYKLVRLGAV